MKYVLIVLGVIVGLVVVGFLLLLLNLKLATSRLRKRIAQKLEPVMQPVREGRQPDPATVRMLAANPEIRNDLYEALEEAGKQQLFPPEFRTRQMFAESDMACWLSHPNELKSAPDEIQLVKVVTIPTTEVGEVQWYLFRFRTKAPHWAADHGWMAGVSGPYSKDPSAKLDGPRGTYSELDPFDSKPPEQHVKELHELAVSRGVLDDLKKPA